MVCDVFVTGCGAGQSGGPPIVDMQLDLCRCIQVQQAAVAESESPGQTETLYLSLYALILHLL